MESFSEALEIDSTREELFLKMAEVMEKVKSGEQTEKEKEDIVRHCYGTDIIVNLSQTVVRRKPG